MDREKHIPDKENVQSAELHVEIGYGSGKQKAMLTSVWNLKPHFFNSSLSNSTWKKWLAD